MFVSGGGFAPYVGDSIIYSGPDWNGATDKLIPNSWIVDSASGYGVSNVTCYQPSGAAIPGVATTVDQTTANSAVAAAAAGRARPLSDQAIAKIGQIKDMTTTAPEAPTRGERHLSRAFSGEAVVSTIHVPTGGPMVLTARQATPPLLRFVSPDVTRSC